MDEAARKTVLITGAHRGIGLKVLEGAARNGYDIIAHARKESGEWKEKLAGIAEAEHVSIRDVYFDMSDPDAIKKAFSELYHSHISIDCLVNNAGITSYDTPFVMTSIASIREMFEINLIAMMQVTQYCLKSMMRKRAGSIVNMASICGEDVLPSNTIYGSSKAAVIAFTKNLASEMGKYNIRVNAVAPGPVKTDMIQPVMDYFAGDYLSSVSLGRLAETEDIMNAVLFLLSDKASYISGQTIRVDGGRF